MRASALMGLAAVLAGSAVRGQSASDVAYCAELSHLYGLYVGSTEFSTRRYHANRDVEARWALSRCEAGDPLPAIPILERRLADARVALPSRK